jgi:septal ring factor EnvC (AmiA/AmiB activator)
MEGCNMPRKKKAKPEKVFMTDVQISEVKKEIASIDNLLSRSKNPDDHVGRKIQDPAELKREKAEREKLLADHAPHRLRGQNANRKLAEARKLAEEIKEAMPRGRDYYNRYPKDSDGHSRQADFERAVNQQIAFQGQDMQKKVLRYKAIMRQIDPSDPTITNIEALRD